MDKTFIGGFGKFPLQKTQLNLFDEDLVPSYHSFIIRGNGKSYGDIAVGETTFSMLQRNKIIDFNEKSGVITCEAGILLTKLNAFIHPKGYRLFVIPGTEQITVGGAIANDVHGKNYSTHGSFGNHILSLKLLTADNKIITCSPTENQDYFYNTIGGIGLTGVILETTIQLRKQKHNSFKVRTKKTNSVSNLVSLFENSQEEFQIAWIKSLNKIVYTEGNYTDSVTKEQNKTRHINFHWWGIFTSKIALSLFEKYMYFKYKEREFIENEKKFLHPLDNLIGWNNLYKNGFIQFQFVAPRENIEKAVELTLDFCKKNKYTTFITTLKKYESAKSIGVMSFPKKGYSFSIDIKYKKGVENELSTLVEQIIDLDGRFNPAKDSILTGEQLAKSYENFQSFKEFIAKSGGQKFESYLSRRVNLHK